MAKRIVILIAALLICICAYNVLINIFPLKYMDLISEQCEKYGLPKDMVCAQIFKESKFESDAVSKKGAVGLMQIMPETGRWCAEKMGMSPYSAEMLKSPEISLEIGCWYLNYLYEKTGDFTWALAAYNGGIANVLEWMDEEVTAEQIPFPETNEYVKKIEVYRKVYKYLYWKEIGR